MRRISSSITFLLLAALPLQMACTTTKISQLNTPPSTLQKGQTVQVHYTGKDGTRQLLKGDIKEVAEDYLIVSHKRKDRSKSEVRTTLVNTKIPYQQIHFIEIVDKRISGWKTTLLAAGVPVVLLVGLAIWIVKSFDPWLGMQ